MLSPSIGYKPPGGQAVSFLALNPWHLAQCLAYSRHLKAAYWLTEQLLIRGLYPLHLYLYLCLIFFSYWTGSSTFYVQSSSKLRFFLDFNGFIADVFNTKPPVTPGLGTLFPLPPVHLFLLLNPLKILPAQSSWEHGDDLTTRHKV